MVNNEHDELMAVIASVFAPAEVSVDSTFDDLGASSLSLLRLISVLQRRFGVVIDVAVLFSAEDISEVIELVDTQRAQGAAVSN